MVFFTATQEGHMNYTRWNKYFPIAAALLALGVVVKAMTQVNALGWLDLVWIVPLLAFALFLLGFQIHQPDHLEELRPWEDRVLEEAKNFNFTPYAELYFVYTIKGEPRKIILRKHFTTYLEGNRETLEAFRAYCKHHSSGGIIGG